MIKLDKLVLTKEQVYTLLINTLTVSEYEQLKKLGLIEEPKVRGCGGQDSLKGRKAE